MAGAPFHDGTGADTGAAYVFTDEGGVWVQRARLTASGPTAFANFGIRVAVADGTIAVGAAPSEFRFPDPSLAPDEAVYVFEQVEGAWIQTARGTGSDAVLGDDFGEAVSLSGDTLVVGARDHGASGAVYVFQRSASGWVEQQAKLVPADVAPGDAFGQSVAARGGIVLVGAPFDDDDGDLSGAAYVFGRGKGGWSERATSSGSRSR